MILKSSSAALVLLVLHGTFALQAQDRKISRAQLPSAVAQTADRETKNATIKGYAT